MQKLPVERTLGNNSPCLLRFTEQPPSTMATNFDWECGGWLSGASLLYPPPLTPPPQHHQHHTSFPTSCFLSPETTTAGVVAENCPPTPPQQPTTLFQGLCPPVAMNNNTTAANVAVTSPMSVHPTMAVPSPQSREASPKSSSTTSSMTGSNPTPTAGRKRRSMHEEDDQDDDEQRKKLLERNRLAGKHRSTLFVNAENTHMGGNFSIKVPSKEKAMGSRSREQV